MDARWYTSALQDVRYKGNLYGIPWRIDIRTLAYRKDFFAEAGLDVPPDTWDDLVAWGKKLTQADGAGRIKRWGVGIGGDLAQFYYNFIWQAGGSFMNKDFTQATLDTPQGREALQFLVDLIHKHRVSSPDAVDPSYDWIAEFMAGRIAILPAVGSSFGDVIRNTAPQLVDQVGGSIPLKHRERVAFQGAGFFGVMQTTKDLEASLQWLEFLVREDNHLAWTVQAGTISPNVQVSQHPMFTENWWLRHIVASIPYGRTTQHGHPAWAQITLPEPGGPLYDMMISALSGRVNVDQAIRTAQRSMERLMARF